MNSTYIEKVLENHGVKFTKISLNNKVTFYCYCQAFSNRYDVITGNDIDNRYSLIDFGGCKTELTNRTLHYFLGY